MKDYSNVKSGIPAEERNHVIEVLEEAAGRPYRDFYTMGYDYQKLINFRRDVTYTAPLGKYPNVQPLSDEAREMITYIYKYVNMNLTWDKTLVQNINLLVVVSLIPYLTSSASKMAAQGYEYLDVIQTAVECISKELKNYDYYNGKVKFTTFFERRLQKAYDILKGESSSTPTSQRQRSVDAIIAKALALLEKRNILNPTMAQISAMTKECGQELSITVVQRFYDEKLSIIPLDSETKSLISESFTKPLVESFESLQIKDMAIKYISLLPPVQQLILNYEIMYIERNGNGEVPEKSIKEIVKKEYPNMSDRDIIKYRENAHAGLAEYIDKNLSMKSPKYKGIGKKNRERIDTEFEAMKFSLDDE